MSLVLGRLDDSKAATLKTHDSRTVHLWGPGGWIEIPIVEFLIGVEYVLTNTDLEQNDPRRLFVERIRASRIGEGWNRGTERIHVADRTEYRDALKSGDVPSR